ncbi:MAG: hypothetical protein EPN72_14130 [Nevskiaceae bacterium]|nr:MAG: hypothetical protein EPN63_01995 [Nevskiaceae bacterium]TBR71335.1 MAG: hypothetical protein EPN72_14130 [Nevskiaceae bacterium]
MYKPLFVAIATAATLGLAAPAFAQTADSPATSAAHAQHKHWQGHGRHARGEHAWPFAVALHKLNLSDAQKKQIHGYLEESRTTIEGEMKNLRAERRAFFTTSPGSPNYASAYQKYSTDAAHAVQVRVQQTATLHTRIYNILTASQQRQLATELAAQASGQE